MTVSTTNTESGPYAANGVTTAFPFTFQVMSPDEVSVISRDADGNDTIVDRSAYSVTLSGAVPSIGTVTFAVAPASGVSIIPFSDPSYTQDIAFEDGSRWLASPVNQANDRPVILAQAARAKANRGLSVPIGETGYQLPPAAQRANRFIGHDANGNPIMSSGTGADAGLRTDLAAETGSALVKAADGNTVQDNLAHGGYFLASGTGAVTRTSKDKQRDTVSVKDFGAAGDGVTDDTAAIQAAVDSLVATGGCVNFPTGRYLVTDTITVSSLYPISLVGNMFGNPSEENYPTILIGAAMDYVIHYIAPGYPTDRNHGGGHVGGLAFFDPTFVSVGDPGTRSIVACLFLQDFILSEVANCTFHYLKGSAIKTEYSVMTTIRGGRFRYCGDTDNADRSIILLGGISSIYATQSFNIEDCRVEVCYSTAYVSATQGGNFDVAVSRCFFESSTDVYPDSANTFIDFDIEGFVLEGCNFNRTVADAVIIGPYGRGRLSGNAWSNLDSEGRSLYLQGSRCVVAANSFADNKSGNSVEVTGSQNEVSVNSFYFAGGLYISGHGSKANSNQIVQPTGTSGYAITLANDEGQALGNRLDGNGATPTVGGIVAYGSASVIGNHFDQWPANACIRRENATAEIHGNKFSATCTTPYTEAVTGTAGINVDGSKVIGARGASLPADATDLASVLTLANAIKARMKTTGGHGLVAD